MPGKQAKVVTPPMLRRMLRRVSRSSFPTRDRAMILLSIKAGLRACEIAGLDWSMVLDPQGRVSRHDPCPRRHCKETWWAADSDASRSAARFGAPGADHGAGRADYPLLSRCASEGEQRGQLVRRAVQRTRLRGLLVAFWPTKFHHGCGAEYPSIRL